MNKLVNNFYVLAHYLFHQRKPLEEDEFYFLQILVRGKDGNPHMNGNNKNRLVKYFIIKNEEQFRSLEKEITGTCDLVNGRAYIHPTRRNAKEVANVCLTTTTQTFLSQNWIGLRGAYSTACGKSLVSSDKQFIVDLDNFDFNDVLAMSSFIDSLRGRKDEHGRIAQCIVPTKNGYHLITNAFDVGEFSKVYPKIDVHKNNPTLLYYRTIENDQDKN